MNHTESTNVLDMFSLHGRVSIVTGASGHLGRALAEALAEAGSRVIVTSRDADSARSVAESLPNFADLQHAGVELDHTDVKSIDRSIKTTLDITGRIDVLVNNAHDKTSADWSIITGDEFNKQLSNVTGYFLLARHVRNDAVRRAEPASIVMLGSMYGQVASYPDAYEDISSASPAAYHALKGGVLQLTRHLAVYWARDKVRVNCLSPGPFPADGANATLIERLNAKVPLARMGRPHELKGALLLLASDAGSYITGHNLIVDGGWTAW